MIIAVERARPRYLPTLYLDSCINGIRKCVRAERHGRGSILTSHTLSKRPRGVFPRESRRLRKKPLRPIPSLSQVRPDTREFQIARRRPETAGRIFARRSVSAKANHQVAPSDPLESEDHRSQRAVATDRLQEVRNQFFATSCDATDRRHACVTLVRTVYLVGWP
jgi:hypothetical protein